MIATLAFPVAVVAVAVVTGGALEFEVGGRLLGINTAQLAALVVALAGAWQAWRRGRVRIDLLGLAMAVLVAVPILQALRDGTSPLAAGGIGRFVTVGLLLAALPQFASIVRRAPSRRTAATGHAQRPVRPPGRPGPWRPDWRAWDTPLVLMGVALAVLVLWHVLPALGDPDLGFYELKDVVRLPLGNHNYVASILAATLALAVARPWRPSWWMAAAVVIGLGLGATLSRGGWLVAGIVLVVLAVVRRDRVTVTVVGALAGLGVLAVGALLVSAPQGRGLGEVLSPATGARTELWAAAWDMFRSQPLLGVGVTRFPDLLPAAITADRLPYQHAHNLVLESLATTGIVGTLAYLAYWAGAAVRVLRLDDASMRWRLGLPLLALFLHAQIDSLNYLLVFEVVLATLIGVAACQPGARFVHTWRIRAE